MCRNSRLGRSRRRGSWVATGAGTCVRVGSEGWAGQAAKNKEGPGEAREAAEVQANWISFLQHSSLQETGCEKSLELHSFLMKPQEGIGYPSVTLRRGPGGLEFWLHRTMLKVASVSTRYLLLVSSSVRKINPALARKRIAMAVACVGMAAEQKEVQWLDCFPTKHRVKHTCEPCVCNSCEIYRCHCQGFK
jgi:hypothetical protein